MSKFQRIRSFLWGLFMLFGSALLLIDPENGYEIVVLVLCIAMLLFGVKMIGYYILMARHMIGGKMILLIGILALDFGLFVFTLSDIPRIYMLLYLFGCHTFYSVVDIMRAVEVKRNGLPTWKYKFAFGVVNLLIALLALVGGIVIRAVWLPVAIYCIGLVYSGVERIVRAFGKADVVFIEK